MFSDRMSSFSRIVRPFRQASAARLFRPLSMWCSWRGSAEREKPYLFVLGHELLHRMRSEDLKAYKQFQEYLLDDLQEDAIPRYRENLDRRTGATEPWPGCRMKLFWRRSGPTSWANGSPKNRSGRRWPMSGQACSRGWPNFCPRSVGQGDGRIPCGSCPQHG